MPTIALADLARAFELHAQCASAGTKRGPVTRVVRSVDLLVVALGSCRCGRRGNARRTGWTARTSHGRRPRRSCSAAPACMRGDLDVVHRDLAEHGFLAAIGLGAERGAFEHLAEIVGRAPRDSRDAWPAAAKIAQSLLRPPMITSAPLSSSLMKGCTPAMATIARRSRRVRPRSAAAGRRGPAIVSPARILRAQIRPCSTSE